MLAALPEALEQASDMLQSRLHHEVVVDLLAECQKMWELDDKEYNAYFTALTKLHNKVATVVVKGDMLQNEKRECILTSVNTVLKVLSLHWDFQKPPPDCLFAARQFASKFLSCLGDDVSVATCSVMNEGIEMVSQHSHLKDLQAASSVDD
eukprot:2977380-Amphidinium_carterae.1